MILDQFAQLAATVETNETFERLSASAKDVPRWRTFINQIPQRPVGLNRSQDQAEVTG